MAATEVKAKKPRQSRTPEGMQVVRFLIPDAEHVKLAQHADNEDRMNPKTGKPDTDAMARLIVRKHLKTSTPASH